MNFALGRFHLAIYLDAPVRNALLSSNSIDEPNALEQAYRRQSRLEAIETDRQRWTTSYRGNSGWRV